MVLSFCMLKWQNLDLRLSSQISYCGFTPAEARTAARLSASPRPSPAGRYERRWLDRRDPGQQDPTINLFWRNECQRSTTVKTAIIIIIIIIIHRKRARDRPHVGTAAVLFSSWVLGFTLGYNIVIILVSTILFLKVMPTVTFVFTFASFVEGDMF